MKVQFPLVFPNSSYGYLDGNGNPFTGIGSWFWWAGAQDSTSYGYQWSLDLDTATNTLTLGRYVNGAWVDTPLSFDNVNGGVAITGNLNVSGSINSGVGAGWATVPFRQISASYNVTNADYFIEATGTAGVPRYPTAVGITGRTYIFKNRSLGSITPLTTSGQTIDGATPAAVAVNGVLRLISDGVNWLTW